MRPVGGLARNVGRPRGSRTAIDLCYRASEEISSKNGRRFYPSEDDSSKGAVRAGVVRCKIPEPGVSWLHGGDQVLVLLLSIEKKVYAEWRGPSVVLKKLSPVDYLIETTKIYPARFSQAMTRKYKFFGTKFQTTCRLFDSAASPPRGMPVAAALAIHRHVDTDAISEAEQMEGFVC